MWQDLTSLLIALGTGFIGILFAAYLSWKIAKKDPGTPAMQEISEAIQQGAMAFLKREYRAIAIFVLIVAVILFVGISKKTAVAFIAGAFCSVCAGYLGMRIATKANCRTAQAASKSYNEAIGVAFPGGAVMGMNVVGIGLFGLSLIYIIYIWHALQHQANLSLAIFEATQLIAGFSMGASSVALFARVGGGIYTKAADVGADLVGKVEKGIPEDDPRNPAVIADNVGDNVGDVAGMGADLFESYIGAIVSALVIAVTTMDVGTKGVMLSMLLSAIGIVATIIGVFFVRTDEKTDPQTALRMGMIVSAVLLIVGAYACTHLWYGSLNLFWAVLSGLLAGMIVGFVAEYFTSGKTVEKIADNAKTGPATVIIEGMAIAMNSTVIPLVVIALATIISYYFAGIFGIALSAIGMLSITGMTVAVDAYGPIADNAAGIAEMAHMGPEVRKRCETLDAVGNTTAAISKGFAIGSAALTALALFVAYSQVISLLSIDAMNATVVAGMFIGGMVPFFFSSKAMQAVGEAAFKVVEEVRRQFKEIPGLMEGKAKPDYARCVDITTAFALQKMVFPSVMAIIIPVAVGIFISPAALGGLLVGSLVSGVPLAIFFSNAGGAWDNSKKYIEAGNLGGKGSDAHKAAVIGDTVGDPFKDTAGPSLNILLKLMAVVSLVLSPLIFKLHVALFALFGR
ncbi:MAG: sodium-translocating pyrophosphatase [bacterium]|nr:sodium-translocating pyrophosphatase [bacterium]MDD5353891.1 sodium-translocating pyrophosphatase [bacterium]MDD5756993.1 sodium-translocating pyrophosphatase [bacterium]